MPYLITGEEVHVIETLANGVLIEVLLESYDEEGETIQAYSPPRIVDKVFEAAPRAKVDAEVAEAQAHLDKLQQLIQLARTDSSNAQRLHANLMISLAKYKPLARLDDYLAGHMTHYVVLPDYGGTPRLITQAELDAERSDRGLDLVQLAGGKLTWKLNRVNRSGDCNSYNVIPCLSLEEARARLQETVDMWANDPPHRHKGLLDCARANDLIIPKGLKDSAYNYVESEARRILNNHKDSMARAQAALDAVLAERSS